MRYYIFLGFAFLYFTNTLRGQTINWRSFQGDQRHIVSLYAGYDYSFAIGAGYGYQWKRSRPVVLNVEYSMPSGQILLDDLKSKIGIQTELVHLGSFAATTRLSAVFRRYENELARISGFGSEWAVAAGYYRSHWFLAGECAMDKAIATKIKHSDLARENFPDIQNGWFVPTAGNFSYGLQIGGSIKKMDIFLRIGKVLTQNFKSTPTIPAYFQVGLNRRW